LVVVPMESNLSGRNLHASAADNSQNI
jgi:hypothetical protein